MGYVGTVSLYSSLLALGYVVALFRRGKETLTNGATLQGRLPPLKPLYVHALLSMIFGPKQLPKRLLSVGFMPQLSINSDSVAVNAQNLTHYRKKCGLSEGKGLPILYPTVETFCMNLACMCLPTFPVSVIGGVLAHYKATMHRPIQETEILTYRQRLLPKMRQTKRGDTEFDMSVSVLSDTGELLWEDTSTFLSFGNQRQGTSKQSEPELDVRSFQASEKWQLSIQDGPQFAALNGDINFIHMHPILARLFGFKSNIAHGVYLVSKSIAAMQTGKQQQFPQAVCASFKRPAVLPGQFTCHWQQGTQGAMFSSEYSVCSEETGKTVLSGKYTCGQDAVAKI